MKRSAFDRLREEEPPPPSRIFTVDSYFRRYDRVYDPVANAKAEAEKAEVRARRHADKVRR